MYFPIFQDIVKGQLAYSTNTEFKAVHLRLRMLVSAYSCGIATNPDERWYLLSSIILA